MYTRDCIFWFIERIHITKIDFYEKNGYVFAAIVSNAMIAIDLNKSLSTNSISIS